MTVRPGWADEFQAFTMLALDAAADAEVAARMSDASGGRFAFIGVPGPVRQWLVRRQTEGMAAPEPDDVVAAALGMWSREGREYQYAAVDLLHMHVATLGHLATADPDLVLCRLAWLVRDRPWWDTVDSLSARVLEALAVSDPAMADRIRVWHSHPDRWLVRAADVAMRALPKMPGSGVSSSRPRRDVRDFRLADGVPGCHNQRTTATR